MENLVNIGTIVGTHHLRGSVKINSIFENIELIQNERVLLEKDDKKRLLTVKNVKRLNEKKAILDFEEIKNDTLFSLTIQTADYELWKRYRIEANFNEDGTAYRYGVRVQHAKWE